MNTHYQTSLLSLSKFTVTPIYYDWFRMTEIIKTSIDFSDIKKKGKYTLSEFLLFLLLFENFNFI